MKPPEKTHGRIQGLRSHTPQALSPSFHRMDRAEPVATRSGRARNHVCVGRYPAAGSSLTTTALDAGVLLPRAVCESGTSTFASGK